MFDGTPETKTEETAASDVGTRISELVTTAKPLAPVVGGGHVTVVLGGKGGVGKTTLALGLASALNRSAPGRIALVDLDLQFGDIVTRIGLAATATVATLAAELADGEALHALSLASRLPDHRGIRVLGSPVAAEHESIIGAEHVRAIIAAMKPAFDHVIIDTSSYFGEAVLGAVDLADRILVVSDLSVGSLRATNLVQSLLHAYAIPAGKARLILNRADVPAPLTADAIQAHLGWAASGLLPQGDRQAVEAARSQAPIIDVDFQSDLSRAIIAVADQLSVSAGGSVRRKAGRGASPVRSGAAG